MAETVKGSTCGVAFLERRGPGPTILLLHGIGSNATSFEPLIDVLPKLLHVIAWNAPGYSGSDPVADAWPEPGDYAEVLARFVDALAVGPVYLLGHSLGSLIAAAFAERYPEKVKALVLAAAANGYGIPRGGELPDAVAGRIDDLKRLGAADFARARSDNLVHDPDRFPDVVARVEAAMSEVNLAGYTQAVRLLASGDLAAMMDRVQLCPGFVIGAQDRITPMHQTEAAATAWERAHGQSPRIIEIAEAGHAVYLQQPEQFAAAMLEMFGLENASGAATQKLQGQGA